MTCILYNGHPLGIELLKPDDGLRKIPRENPIPRFRSVGDSDLFLGRFPQNRSQLFDYFIVACECGLIGTTKVSQNSALGCLERGSAQKVRRAQSCFLEARRAFVILELSANMSKHA